jgi:hypothetical protein
MSVSAPANNMKKRIMLTLDKLPPEGLKEVINFLDYVRFKFKKKQTPTAYPPYQPVSLGALWKDEKIDSEDIAEIRREMWQSIEGRDL